MVRTLTTILLTAWLLTACALIPRAATRLTEDLTELVKAAEAVVEVRILSRRVEPQSRFGVPMTIAQAEVLTTFKGGATAGQKIELEVLGGHDGATQSVVPGQPKFIDGARSVVLLSRGTDHRWRVVAGDAGQIALNADGARRLTGQFEYYVSSTESLTGYVKESGVSISRERLDQLLAALVNTGKPVLELTPAPVPSAMQLTTFPESGTSPLPLLALILLSSLVLVMAQRLVRRLSH